MLYANARKREEENHGARNQTASLDRRGRLFISDHACCAEAPSGKTCSIDLLSPGTSIISCCSTCTKTYRRHNQPVNKKKWTWEPTHLRPRIHAVVEVDVGTANFPRAVYASELLWTSLGFGTLLFTMTLECPSAARVHA